VVQQRQSGRRRAHAVAFAQQQGHAQLLLHAAHARAGRRQRQAGPLGAGGDAARFGDMQEKAQVGEIETHGGTGK
jgi:hypothetical protein